ncbi:proline iminopeptidase-family hydrolase [Amnibacterium sp. CER49]|uniref:proline iminopeptidase-family hydrolase n=1 Tax=Amnibacterium sp. CER49 TaxID=3039161 RepID=UPI0024482F77|nr:proline iminopeptidase-family hydrolase [Amnibacterium sp. CER49]MDH2445234.1 proline iminopeptidase-family hydrolase [Amnibacterium sp. CER49]
MPVRTLEIPFRDWTTWAQVTEPEQPKDGGLPVIVLHGGPGMAHDYVRNLAALSHTGRTVVHYDQLGCGRSTHLPDAPKDLWTPQLFVDEFHNLVSALGFERYHVVGQSWGGMLGAEIAVRRPAGLASLSILNSPASMPLWVAGCNRLKQDLPPRTRDALDRHEAAGTYDDPEYLAAVDVFYRRHVCRLDPWPADLIATLEQEEADPTVYFTMNGPSEFTVIGSLKEWSVIERLPQVEVPTLVLAGELDEATPEAWQPFVDGIPDTRTVVVPDASHCSHLERPQEVLGAVTALLDEAERA